MEHFPVLPQGVNTLKDFSTLAAKILNVKQLAWEPLWEWALNQESCGIFTSVNALKDVITI